MPVTPYFRMIENLVLRSWHSVWQSTSRHQMESLVPAGLALRPERYNQHSGALGGRRAPGHGSGGWGFESLAGARHRPRSATWAACFACSESTTRSTTTAPSARPSSSRPSASCDFPSSTPSPWTASTASSAAGAETTPRRSAPAGSGMSMGPWPPPGRRTRSSAWHRLNRSGDRQLNRALHTIVLARLRDDPATRAYAARGQAEGRSVREIRCCLKRAVARQLFKLLERYGRAAVEVAGVRWPSTGQRRAERPLDGWVGRSHSDAWVGCMVWSTTASNSVDRVPSSIWSRRRALNAATVRAAS
jgi:hypothetical protein